MSYSGLYLIVIVNPRFKASLRLTEPRTAGAVTKSGAYHCPGIHAVRMFLDMEIYTPPYICRSMYNTSVNICLYIYYVKDKLDEN